MQKLTTPIEYTRAKAGEIKHLIGRDDPYELPESSKFKIQTSGLSVNDSISLLVDAVFSSCRSKNSELIFGVAE